MKIMHLLTHDSLKSQSGRNPSRTSMTVRTSGMDDGEKQEYNTLLISFNVLLGYSRDHLYQAQPDLHF